VSGEPLVQRRGVQRPLMPADEDSHLRQRGSRTTIGSSRDVSER
jgi:hypothetical protein